MTPDHQTNRPMDWWTDEQSLLWSCMSTTKKKERKTNQKQRHKEEEGLAYEWVMSVSFIWAEIYRNVNWYKHHTLLTSTGRGMRYLREGLMQQVFTKDRLRHVVTLRNNSFPSAMKQHTKVVREIYAPMMLSNKSMESILSLLAQRRLLSTIADDIQ